MKQLYRVMEYQKSFYIQGYFEQFRTADTFTDLLKGQYGKRISAGFIWSSVDPKGKESMYMRRLGISGSYLPPFPTLEEAMYQIDVFKSETKYHYPKEDMAIGLSNNVPEIVNRFKQPDSNSTNKM